MKYRSPTSCKLGLHQARTQLIRARCLAVVVVLVHLSCCVSAARIAVPNAEYDERLRQELCCPLRRVCVDQGVYVLYHPEDDPRQGGVLPKCFKEYRANHFITDLHGTSDIWALQSGTPGPLLRPATQGEESPALQNPVFSNRTTPFIMYTHFDRIFAELLRRLLLHLYWCQQNGVVRRSHTLVLSAGGMQLESLHRWLLAPYSDMNITSLSHLSSRLPADSPEDYTVEGTHVRCFEQMQVCSFRHRSGRKALSQLWPNAQFILDYYRPSFKQLPKPLPPELEGDLLKVVIIARKRTGLRNIINREEVLEWCRAYRPPLDAQAPYTSTYCILHIPGADFKTDLALTSKMDVIIGLHGSGLYNALFMPKAGSVIEVRPYMFGQTGWANAYLKADLRRDNDALLWWGIDVVNATRSSPGTMEVAERGQGHKRDRNTIINTAALHVLMDRIAYTNKRVEDYRRRRLLNETHITDDLGVVTWKLT